MNGKCEARKRVRTFVPEIGREELLQRPFQVRHGDVTVDGQTLDLVEHGRMGLVVIGAVDAARGDHPARGAMGLHVADLHRAGVGAQHVRRTIVALGAVHVERVHLGPRGGWWPGMFSASEIVPVGLDLRPLGDSETHVGEYGRYFLGDLGHGMDRAHAAMARGKRDVEPLGPKTLIERGIGKCCLLRGDGGVHLVLQRIERGPRDLAFLGGHAAQLAHPQADIALLAEGGDAKLLQHGLVASGTDPAQPVRFSARPSRPSVPCPVKQKKPRLS